MSSVQHIHALGSEVLQGGGGLYVKGCLRQERGGVTMTCTSSPLTPLYSKYCPPKPTRVWVRSQFQPELDACLPDALASPL